MTTKSLNITYWTSTVIFSILMIFSAAGGLKPTEDAIKFMHDLLGFPVYFIVFISYAKVIGVLAILVPGLNRHIKEWAYAGLFFDLAAAIYSNVAAAGKFDPQMLGLLAWILPGVISYYCWLKKERKA